jgi:DMSO/TMAO reductase YedYZ heme-binding membrane subunit
MAMKDASFAKLVLFVNSTVPLALLGWDWYWHQLGTNPINFALRTAGMCALVFLILTLSVTPVRLISGYNFLSNFRRQLGLWAFAYGVVHLIIYFVFDQSMNLTTAVHDILQRRFIFLGMTSLTLMIPLALTSTTGMIKRLGAAKWKRLHQLVYLSAIAAVIHFYMLVKSDIRMPMGFIIVLLVLLAYRPLSDRFRFLRRTRKPVAVAR